MNYKDIPKATTRQLEQFLRESAHKLEEDTDEYDEMLVCRGRAIAELAYRGKLPKKW